MDAGTIAIIGLCLFLALWYGGGHLYNRRRGQRLFHWLERGLEMLGGEVEAGWIGSPASGARINVIHAAPPFRRLEITLLLENREIPFLWLFDRLRGKRDWLIIRATLRSPRRGEMEVGSAKRKAARRREQPWTWQEGPHGLAVAYQGPGAQKQVAALEPWLEAYGAHLHRFFWHKTDPHIQLQMKVGGLLPTPSEKFLADLQAAIGGAKHINK
ncbi:MAG: hypothetical protein DRI79_13380 [Chloroflexi bacterium]|nr:MAG: hypothetical protein DRI79_13380 [Chloroflexota bacterium]HEY67636.1 hypothetical protein [Thermoflexia bacterium]